MKLPFSLPQLLQRMRRFPWSLGLALGMIIYFTPHPEWHGDLYNFREAVETLRHPYYARWLFALLRLPPEPVAYVALSLVCTAALYFAVRTFGGKHWMLFTSFAFAWTLYYGQIDGLVVGGLALSWWAIQQKRPYLVGVGLILASLKPQLSFMLLLLLWWWSPHRLKALAIPLAVFALSLVQWGWWVPQWLQALTQTPDLVYLSRNLSLWPELGWWVWLIWLPILTVPMQREGRLLAAAAGTALSTPYFPLPSAVLLLAMPMPGWGYLALQIPAVTAGLGWYDFYWAMKGLPPLLALWALRRGS